MNILSFEYGIGCHDTSAAIICDGVLVAAVEEERFTRRKHDSAFPSRSIEFCLRQAGLSMEHVDFIAFPEKPYRSGPHSYLAGIDWHLLRRLHAQRKTRFRNLVHKRILDALLRAGIHFNWQMFPELAAGFAELRRLYPVLPPMRFYEHHHSHAAASFFTTGLDRAAIVTLDYRGGFYSTMTWAGQGNRITRLRAETFQNSLGELYWDATHFLGFGNFGEGKTMGLAPYGDPSRFEALFASILERRNSAWFDYRGWPSGHALGFPPRTDQSPLDAPYPDLAAAVQAALEAAEQKVIRSAIEEAGSRTVCLGGGVALNCSANGALLESGLAHSAWVFPAVSDAGLSVGAALLCAAECGEWHPARLEHAYWGPEFGPKECEAALLREPRATFQLAAGPVEEHLAEALANGQIVGVCRGRMEFGPRALGNRSILADPRRLEVRDRVNRLKGRELWRPLAPAVLAEHASEFFSLRQSNPFMLFRAQVHTAKRAAIPAVVHVDGSARPQTITRLQNSFFYDLISAFFRLTGIPVLLNTSFNVAGEPIVCTPEDAIKTFFASGLDLLVLGDFIVTRRSTAENAQALPDAACSVTSR
jgi:carbamoyltransferase